MSCQHSPDICPEDWRVDMSDPYERWSNEELAEEEEDRECCWECGDELYPKQTYVIEDHKLCKYCAYEWLENQREE